VHGATYAIKKLRHPAIAAAVYGHHAGLPDWDGHKDWATAAEAATEIALRAAEAIGFSLPGKLTQPFPLPPGDEHSRRRFEFWTRVLFSALVDADRVETERFYTGGRPDGPRLDTCRAVELLNKLHAARAEKSKKAAEGKSDPKLLALRNRIYDECVRTAERDRGFFELTVPTGGGKTLSGMAFALAHAKRHGLRRVIVVIPYLSIIEQNAREYQSALGSENVVEHHSAVAEQEVGGIGVEPTRRSAAELATENWDAPVILTTSVQFLETLLEASPRRCRKLHNVARSIVLFDEAQALPTNILNPLVSVFRELVETFGCSIVFSTATQPAFRCGTGLTEGLKPEELKPILSVELVAESFRSLQRVEYRPEFGATWDWETLVGRLTEGGHTQGLCVLNTRRHAREVWEKLREKIADRDAIFHLSSAMCAEHRIAVLGDSANPAPGSVRHRLKHALPCWLVSTQVIEAGVDVDFPRVFRALGPLDSIVQAAGRCNREGKLKRGEVVVFQPDDPGIPRGLYQMAAGEARTFLGEYTGEQLATDPAIFARYFDIIYGRADCDAHGLQRLRAAFQFREVEGLARVIEDGGTPVIVPYKAAMKWIKRIRKIEAFDRPIMRRLQRFTVNLRTGDLVKLQSLGSVIRLLGDDSPWVLHDSCYDRHLGVLVRGLSPDDFLQFDIKEKR
jgi:CRISPR-associated endonuclease/helicase Cas3